MEPFRYPQPGSGQHFSLLGVLLGDSGQLFTSPFLSVEDRKNLRLVCKETRDLTLSLLTEARVMVDAHSLANMGLEGPEGARRLAIFHGKLPCLTKLRLEARGLKPGASDATALSFTLYEAQRTAQGWLELYLQHAWLVKALTHVSVAYTVELSDLPLPLSFWHLLSASVPSLQELHARLSFRAPVVNNSLLPITAAFASSSTLKALVVTVLWRHFDDGPGDLLDLAPLRYTASLEHFSMPNSCMDERDMAAMASGTPKLQALVCSGMRFSDPITGWKLLPTLPQLTHLTTLSLLGRSGCVHSLAALVCRPSIAVQYALWQLEMLLSFMPRLTRLEGALIHVADQPGAADASASGHGHGYGIGNGNSASGENTPEPLGKRLHSIVSRLSTRGSVYALSLSVPSKAWSSVAHHGPYLCTPALILSLLDLHATEAENVQHARNVAAVFPNLTTLMVEVPLSTRGLPCVHLFRALAHGLPHLRSLWVSCFTRFATEEGAWVAEVPDTSMAVALALMFPPHVTLSFEGLTPDEIEACNRSVCIIADIYTLPPPPLPVTAAAASGACPLPGAVGVGAGAGGSSSRCLAVAGAVGNSAAHSAEGMVGSSGALAGGSSAVVTSNPSGSSALALPGSVQGNNLHGGGVSSAFGSQINSGSGTMHGSHAMMLPPGSMHGHMHGPIHGGMHGGLHGAGSSMAGGVMHAAGQAHVAPLPRFVPWQDYI